MIWTRSLIKVGPININIWIYIVFVVGTTTLARNPFQKSLINPIFVIEITKKSYCFNRNSLKNPIVLSEISYAFALNDLPLVFHHTRLWQRSLLCVNVSFWNMLFVTHIILFFIRVTYFNGPSTSKRFLESTCAPLGKRYGKGKLESRGWHQHFFIENNQIIDSCVTKGAKGAGAPGDTILRASELVIW